MSGRRLAIAVGVAVLVLVLHAIPRRTLEGAGVGEISRKEGPDKLVHVALFAVLGLSWLVAAPRRPLSVLLGCLAYGVLLEVMQTYCVAGRTGSARDFAADAVGLAAVGLTRAGWRVASSARAGPANSSNPREDLAP